MSVKDIIEKLSTLSEEAQNLSSEVKSLLSQAQQIPVEGSQASPFLLGLTVFILACFVGYYVVWRVTPALHSPLMAVTNAISSVIIVGALIAMGPELMGASKLFGFIAIALASVNIFGGFIITQRMLDMFKKKQ